MGHLAPLLPQNAPFSSAERAWINGFLAGLLGPGAETAPSSPPAVAAPTSTALVTEDTPWHDPTLALDDRLALAEGRPRAQLLMAAMAQQDCGQCGYLCRTYAEAIDRVAQTSLRVRLLPRLHAVPLDHSEPLQRRLFRSHQSAL